nr:hypothetical protein [Saprospiraceae bacterium]
VSGTKRLNIGLFETKAEAEKILEQVKLISPSGFIKTFIPEDLGDVVDLRNPGNREETISVNINLYFDYDQPSVENTREPSGELRDYTSFFEGYLTGVDFDQTVRPYRDDSEYQAQRNQLRLADAALANDPNIDPQRIRYRDYLEAGSGGIGKGSAPFSSCNGDTTELAVSNFFKELRSNYSQFTTSFTNQVLLLYEAGYDIKITLEGTASGSGVPANNISLSSRRIATITEYLRNYMEKEVGEFDAERISYVVQPLGSEGYKGNYPRTGLCRIYDVRAARDRKVRIVRLDAIRK